MPASTLPTNTNRQGVQRNGLITENNDVVCPIYSYAESIDISAEDYTSTDPFLVFIGTGGDLDVTLSGGTRVVFKNLPDGYEFKGHVTTVHTGTTTATDLLACL